MTQPESDNSDSWRGVHGVAGSRLSSGIGTWPKLKSRPLLGGLFSDDQEAEPLVQSARANVDLEHVQFDHAQIRRSCILDKPMHQTRSKAPALERRHDFDARDVQRDVAGLVGIDDTSTSPSTRATMTRFGSDESSWKPRWVLSSRGPQVASTTLPSAARCSE